MEDAVKVIYDERADVMRIRLSRKRPDGGTDVHEGVAVLTAPDGRIVEIEIREASRRVPAGMLARRVAA
jgi:uncharacterized protein YuzE